MKKILFAILLLPFCAMAQDTAANQCRLIKETDPYTKEIKLSTGFVFLDGGSVTIDADSKEIIVLFSLDGPEKCFDNNGTADVFFEGIKSKTMSRNAGTMNCEGLFQFVFKNTHNTPTTLLQRICTKKITHILFTGNGKKPVTVNVGPKEQEALMALANCLVTEGRTLIR
jgi:hypothetical protein